MDCYYSHGNHIREMYTDYMKWKISYYRVLRNEGRMQKNER
jgi:hypothetical protein